MKKMTIFVLGFLVMAAADVIIWKTKNVGTVVVTNILSGMYCLRKFCKKPWEEPRNILILFYIAVTMLAGFQWTITMFFLTLFACIEAFFDEGGNLC